MIASTQSADIGNIHGPLSRVPARAFGESDWVTLALENCAAYLEPAIASGKPYRIANAIRAVAHAPTPEQVDDIVDAVCDHMLAEAYTNRNSRMITAVADARTVVEGVLAEINEQSERAALEPALLRETIDGFVRMAGLSDKRLADRLDAVGSLAARIAAAMHVPRSMVLNAEFAGRLHDIGLMSVPKERGLKTHSIIGESFIAAVPSIAHLAPIVRSHHERYDGSGFPDGLRADEIPLESRIICVAAAFIDLITETSRHKAISPQDACEELAGHTGSKFDPDVVTATLHLLHYRQRTNRSA
jgi:HD-GYP domain-containing protein (c-di-GMP phosphodiesterase class II)